MVSHPLLVSIGTIESKTNVTPKDIRLSEKLQLTASLRNEILTAVTNLTYVIIGK